MGETLAKSASILSGSGLSVQKEGVLSSSVGDAKLVAKKHDKKSPTLSKSPDFSNLNKMEDISFAKEAASKILKMEDKNSKIEMGQVSDKASQNFQFETAEAKTTDKSSNALAEKLQPQAPVEKPSPEPPSGLNFNLKSPDTGHDRTSSRSAGSSSTIGGSGPRPSASGLSAGKPVAKSEHKQSPKSAKASKPGGSVAKRNVASGASANAPIRDSGLKKVFRELEKAAPKTSSNLLIELTDIGRNKSLSREQKSERMADAIETYAETKVKVSVTGLLTFATVLRSNVSLVDIIEHELGIDKDDDMFNGPETMKMKSLKPGTSNAKTTLSKTNNKLSKNKRTGQNRKRK